MAIELTSSGRRVEETAYLMDGLAASPSEHHERREEKSGTDRATGGIDRRTTREEFGARWRGYRSHGRGAAKPKSAIQSPRRARRYTRAETVFSKLENIASGFKELLERCFSVFTKIIRIPSGFEELLEI